MTGHPTSLSRVLAILLVLGAGIAAAQPQSMFAARIDTGPNSASTSPTAQVVAETPGFGLTVAGGNLGDFVLGLPSCPLLPAYGAVMANHYAGAAVFVEGIEIPCGDTEPGVLTESCWQAGSSILSGEINLDFSLAYFPYATGWIGGLVAGDGNLIRLGNLPPGSSVVRTATGEYAVSLGGIDSQADGDLYVVGASNEDNVAVACPVPGGSWQVRVMDNEANFPIGEDDDFHFVYVPYSAANLAGGRVAPDGSMIHGAGGASVVKTGTGVYRIAIPGVSSASQGILLVGVSHLATTAAGSGPDDNTLRYTFDSALGAFVVRSYDLGNGPLATAQDTGFCFAYVPFAAPLSVDPGGSIFPCGFQLSMGTVAGPTGSVVEIRNLYGAPGAPYFTCLTIFPGAFPTGFWFGISPSFPELAAQITTPAPPFQGILDATGASLFAVPVGAPLGVTFYGVTVQLSGIQVTDSTDPVTATL